MTQNVYEPHRRLAHALGHFTTYGWHGAVHCAPGVAFCGYLIQSLYLLSSISLLVIFVHMMLRLPTHEVAREREHQSIHRPPSDQNSKVEADAGVQVEQDLTAAFHDVV